jgi:hypothetical protein
LAFFKASRVTMDSLPFTAQGRQIGGQDHLDAVDLLQPEPIVFPQLRRSVRTMQIEHGLAALADDMDMCGTMIVRIDHGAQGAQAKHRRHPERYHKPKRLGTSLFDARSEYDASAPRALFSARYRPSLPRIGPRIGEPVARHVAREFEELAHEAGRHHGDRIDVQRGRAGRADHLIGHAADQPLLGA